MTDTIHLSLREASLVTDRLLLLAGVHSGTASSVRDLFLAGTTLGLDTLAALDPVGPHRRSLAWQAATPDVRDGVVAVDGGGCLSLLVLLPACDLAAALAPQDGAPVRIRLSNVAAPELVPAAIAYLPTLGARGKVDGDGDLLVSADGAVPAATSWHATLVTDGVELDRELWWRLYHRSNDSLTEDTEVSRRHAGATIAHHGESDPVPESEVDPDYVASLA